MFGDEGGDFIDAADGESPGGRDTVDCGPGDDSAITNRNDRVKNCENLDRVPIP